MNVFTLRSLYFTTSQQVILLLSSPVLNGHLGKVYRTSATDTLCMAFSGLLLPFLGTRSGRTGKPFEANLKVK